MKKKLFFCWLILPVSLLLLPTFSLPPTPVPQPLPVTVLARQQSLPLEENVVSRIIYQKNVLFVDRQRDGYTGGLRLVVPAMGLDCAVLDGTEPDTLEQGPGLYQYAQMPSWGNPNVSIAGHRDVFGSPFLNIHVLKTDDPLYLVWMDNIYCYRWWETSIVTAGDWSVIHCGAFSCVTLTSCDPIGTSLNRIVAVGRLEKVVPYSADFVFE